MGIDDLVSMYEATGYNGRQLGIAAKTYAKMIEEDANSIRCHDTCWISKHYRRGFVVHALVILKVRACFCGLLPALVNF